MFVKIHKSYRAVVAICDDELLGKKFEEEKSQIDVKESFFKGDKKSSKETEEIIEKMAAEDATFNIVGEKSVALAIKCGVIHEEGIIRIQGIPIALVLM